MRPADFTTAEKLAELRRERRQRERVYARLVEQRKMSRHDADRYVAILDAIIRDYDAKLAEDPQAGGMLL